jgi:hypothetical protein
VAAVSKQAEEDFLRDRNEETWNRLCAIAPKKWDLALIEAWAKKWPDIPLNLIINRVIFGRVLASDAVF